MQRIQNYTHNTHNHACPFDEHTMLIGERGGTLLTINIIRSLTQREHDQMVTQSFQNLTIPSHFSNRRLEKRRISHQYKCLLPWCRQCPIDILRSGVGNSLWWMFPLSLSNMNHTREQNNLLPTGFSQKKIWLHITVEYTSTGCTFLWKGLGLLTISVSLD
jgi:hypothetical protein